MTALANLEPIGTKAIWTKMQTESGQGLADIVRRKEAERRAGGGTFLWGIGNAPAKGLPELLAAGERLPVLFSVMKSRPQLHDIVPETVARWTSYIAPDGSRQTLPSHMLTTSSLKRRDHHYALMCRSAHPLTLGDLGPFDHQAWCNAQSGKPIGGSQVTSFVQRRAADSSASYRIAMRAELIGWVKLVEPVILSATECLELERPSSCGGEA